MSDCVDYYMHPITPPHHPLAAPPAHSPLSRPPHPQNGGKLSADMTGPVWEVFAKLLRGLSGARITRPGHFKNAAGDGVSVRCSYKADDGQLYPLDRGFFYVHKPPLLIPDNDIESVEFARQGSGAVSSTVRTFDLVVRLKGGAEHQFRWELGWG